MLVALSVMMAYSLAQCTASAFSPWFDWTAEGRMIESAIVR
jgi:hypothetical protein